MKEMLEDPREEKNGEHEKKKKLEYERGEKIERKTLTNVVKFDFWFFTS